jgi:hypothetical protein
MTAEGLWSGPAGMGGTGASLLHLDFLDFFM